MSSSQLHTLRALTQIILPFSLFGLFGLQGCGSTLSQTGETSSTNASNPRANNDISIVKENSVTAANVLEGTWIQACVPNGVQSEERLILKNGKFTREFVIYSNNCAERKDAFTTSGTFIVGDAAVNTKELVYENGNFVLKPASLTGFRNIDFTIDAWTFSLSADLSGQDDADIQALKAECPALDIRKESTHVSIQRNGCSLKNLPHFNFDIVSVQDDKLTTGIYINDLNSFDPAGGTTPELRNNVMNSSHMTRVKIQ